MSQDESWATPLTPKQAGKEPFQPEKGLQHEKNEATERIYTALTSERRCRPNTTRTTAARATVGMLTTKEIFMKIAVRDCSVCATGPHHAVSQGVRDSSKKFKSKGGNEVSFVMAASATGRPRCFFDVSIDGIEQGRIVFELCVPMLRLALMQTDRAFPMLNATLALHTVAGKHPSTSTCEMQRLVVAWLTFSQT